jgi:hypothetical protein
VSAGFDPAGATLLASFFMMRSEVWASMLVIRSYVAKRWLVIVSQQSFWARMVI